MPQVTIGASTPAPGQTLPASAATPTGAMPIRPRFPIRRRCQLQKVPRFPIRHRCQLRKVPRFPTRHACTPQKEAFLEKPSISPCLYTEYIGSTLSNRTKYTSYRFIHCINRISYSSYIRIKCTNRIRYTLYESIDYIKWLVFTAYI